MTYEQAVGIRTRQLQGHAIEPDELAAAIALIQSMRTPTPKSAPKNKKREKQKPPLEQMARPIRTAWLPASQMSPQELREATDKAWQRIGSGE